MLRRRLVVLAVSAVATGGVLAWLLLGSGPAGSSLGGDGQPELRLQAGADNVTVTSFHGLALIDPRIWLTARRAALEIDVKKADSDGPMTVTQRLYLPGGDTTSRPLPSTVADGWQGLPGFLLL